MKTLSILLLALPLMAQPNHCDITHSGPVKITNCYHAPYSTSYKWSVATLIAGTTTDAASSWGRMESNPALGTRFNLTSLAIKGGITTGSLLLQRRAILRNSKMEKVFTWINFGEGAALGGIAAHNGLVLR